MAPLAQVLGLVAAVPHAFAGADSLRGTAAAASSSDAQDAREDPFRQLVGSDEPTPAPDGVVVFEPGVCCPEGWDGLRGVKNCKWYFRCVNGTTDGVLKPCRNSEALLFDDARQHCVPKTEVTCPAEEPCVPPQPPTPAPTPVDPCSEPPAPYYTLDYDENVKGPQEDPDCTTELPANEGWCGHDVEDAAIPGCTVKCNEREDCVGFVTHKWGGMLKIRDTPIDECTVHREGFKHYVRHFPDPDEHYCKCEYSDFERYCGRREDGLCMLNVYTGTWDVMRDEPHKPGTCRSYCARQNRECVDAVGQYGWPADTCVIDAQVSDLNKDREPCDYLLFDQICICS